MTELHPLVIIGSGPAAWTAAIYAGRAALSPIVLAGEQGGGQLMLTTRVENYSGFPEGIMGPELMAGMRKQAERQGVQIIDEDAKSLGISDQVTKGQGDKVTGDGVTSSLRHFVTSSLRHSITSAAVIIATGATANTLKLPGEEKLMGRGVGTCAVCDAPFYRGKDMVLVIGGGDSAAEEAGELAKFVKKVIILVRKDVMRASAVMHNRIKGLQNVEIWYKSEVKEFLGEKRLEKVRIIKDGKEEVISADGAFYAIGHTPATGWLTGSGVTLDEKGYIITPLSAVMLPSVQKSMREVGGGKLDNEVRSGKSHISLQSEAVLASHFSLPTSTSVPGVFAAGDCVDSRYKQAITAAGYGCMAALDAQRWIEEVTEGRGTE